jgi:hypothetical protein
MEHGCAEPRGEGEGTSVGDSAGGTSIGREERTSNVDCCETGPVKSGFEEGVVLPLEDHCLKPSTELE